jgi:hypothetical protein
MHPERISPILNRTMTFKCSRLWEELDPTQVPNVRYCSQCQHEVTVCDTQDQLDELAARGKCVAFHITPVRQLLGSVAPRENRPVESETMRKFIDRL